jgi:hypothetical protein
MKKKFTTVDKLDVIDILLSKYGDITLKSFRNLSGFNN